MPAPRYTDRQRDAISAAVLDQGLPATEAVRLAGTGGLVRDLAAFDIPVSSARDIVQAERRRRGEGLPVAEQIEARRVRLLRIVDAQTRLLERRARTKVLEPSEVRALRELAEVTRKLGGPAEIVRSGAAPAGGSGAVGLLERLAADSSLPGSAPSRNAAARAQALLNTNGGGPT